MNDPAALIAFLHARITEDETWAREASRKGDRYTPTGEHWRWECESTDTPAAIDPMLDEYVRGVDNSFVGLRSIEQYPTTWGSSIPHLVISEQSELSPAVAEHIARHDPARVLAEVAAKRARINRWEQANRLLPEGESPSVIRNELLSVRRAYALVLADDAQVYDQHPDYRLEWRPE